MSAAKQEERNLYVFGYGLALLIPVLMLVRSPGIPPGAQSVWAILIAFAVTLWVVVKISGFKPAVNSWIFLIQYAAFHQKTVHGGGASAFVLLAVSVLLLIVTIVRVPALKPVYVLWMKVAHGIGSVITTVIMAVVYFLVFSPVGIMLRIMRKDLLDRKLEPERRSYWILRQTKEQETGGYKKQF